MQHRDGLFTPTAPARSVIEEQQRALRPCRHRTVACCCGVCRSTSSSFRRGTAHARTSSTTAAVAFAALVLLLLLLSVDRHSCSFDIQSSVRTRHYNL
eukprot:SAG25_NODE_11164_length_312_cov_0.615023_1_plen_97_part_10